MKIFSIFLLTSLSSLCASVSSTTGSLHLDVNNDGVPEASLSSMGFSIGVADASANLVVNGNALLQKQLCIGGLNGGANLNLQGTIGFSPKLISSVNALTLNNNSVYLVNTATVSNNVWLTLPNASDVPGRVITVKKISMSHRVTITAASNIDHSTAIVLSTSSGSFPCAEIMSNGSSWSLLHQTDETLNATSPTSMSNLELWLDANDQTSLTFDTSGNISEWQDKSGHGRSATEATESKRPSYVRQTVNGMPSLRGSEHQIRIFSGVGLSLNESRTIFLVCQPSGSNLDSELISIDSGRKIDFGSSSHTNRLRLRNTDHGLDLYSAAGTVLLNQSHMITVTASSGSTIAYRGDTEIINTTSEVFHYDMTGTVRLFASNLTGRDYNGDVCEILIYSRVLSSAERTLIWQYLSQKWGVDL